MMTTNEIAAILTMTCDKAGDIATKLQPLAVEVVRQYQMRGLAMAIVGVVEVVMIIVIAYIATACAKLCIKAITSDTDQIVPFVVAAMGFIVSMIMAIVLAVNGFSLIEHGISQYVAPICGLIGK